MDKVLVGAENTWYLKECAENMDVAGNYFF